MGIYRVVLAPYPTEPEVAVSRYYPYPTRI
jgi:hypothetical protein